MQLRFGFTGEQLDPESGLVYLRARFYDPAQGRFLSKDPLGFGGGDITLYSYALNNPANWADPSGMDTFYQDALGVCEERGWSCRGMPQGVARDILFGGTTEVDPFDPISAFTQGSPADQAVFAASLLVGGAEEDAAARAVTKTDLIKEQLTDETLQAAWREARDEVVSLKGSGEPYDHVTKVRQAQRGLLNRIKAIKNRLGYPDLKKEEVQPLIDELREASRLLDKSEGYLPR